EISSIDANFNSLNYSRSSGISLAINAARTSFIINYGVLGRTYVNIYFGKYEETKLILDKGVPVHTVVQIEPDTNIAYLYINGDFFASKELESEYNPNINKISGGNLSHNITWSNFSKKPLMSGRAYNRPLTPEEIAHNYAIEKERFGIE